MTDDNWWGYEVLPIERELFQIGKSYRCVQASLEKAFIKGNVYKLDSEMFFNAERGRRIPANLDLNSKFVEHDGFVISAELNSLDKDSDKLKVLADWCEVFDVTHSKEMKEDILRIAEKLSLLEK